VRAPEFWYPAEEGGALPAAARLLLPFAYLYDRIARLSAARGTPHRAAIPVICVGNLTAGGTGKTPVALAIAAALAARGQKPVFLTRGYGGLEKGPLLVDPARHSAGDVGDEPLLLARAGKTIVARDRAEGAKAALREGASAIIMDDGFQNPQLAKDLSLIVIDSEIGFGNGRVIPAGPLREPVAQGLARAQAVVLLGPGVPPAALAGFPRPVLRARFAPDAEAAQKLRGRTVLAFAGIGRPAKFFDSLTALGATLMGAEAFADHHPFSNVELEALKARAGSAPLVTTEKDYLRLRPDQRAGVTTLPVRVVFEEPAALEALLSGISARAKEAQDPGAR
jgi:tetraacyldisaccharide 4'-kinase